MSIIFKEVTKRPTEQQAERNVNLFFKLNKIYNKGLSQREKTICLTERELVEELGHITDPIYLCKVVARVSNCSELFVTKTLRKYESILIYEEYFLN
jgi:putative lipase involved disintegration of autophagic bodies